MAPGNSGVVKVNSSSRQAHVAISLDLFKELLLH